jgi:hypothetical protein
MPIRRELRALYPPHWKELSRRVRFDRARGRCEACGRPHATLIRCLPDGRRFDPAQQTWRDRRGRHAHWPDLLAMIPARTTRVLLAAAHLDHDPSNNRLRNLKCFCQRCHLLHDRPYHRAQRWITYRCRYAAGDLFIGFYIPSQVSIEPNEIAAGGKARGLSPLAVVRAFMAASGRHIEHRELSRSKLAPQRHRIGVSQNVCHIVSITVRNDMGSITA